MKELGLKLVSEASGLSSLQLVAEAEAAVVQAPAAPAASFMYPSANFQDMPSLMQMSALGSGDLFTQSLFHSMFQTNSFPFVNPEASLFSLLMSQQVQQALSRAVALCAPAHPLQGDFNNMFAPPMLANAPASMGESALNMVKCRRIAHDTPLTFSHRCTGRRLRVKRWSTP